MLRVTYDHQIFSFSRFGGVARYCYELAKRVAHAEGFSASIAAPLYINDYIEQGGVKVSGVKVPHIARTEPLIMGINRALAPVANRLSRPDIVHETYFFGDALAANGCRSVITVYDMIHERFPNYFRRAARTSGAKRAAVMRADRVLCISENTRRDLIELFGVPEEKTRTIYLGFSELATSGDPGAVVKRPFFLYVGQRGHYKNFAALLKAYASSTLLCEFDIVAFGGGGFSSAEKEDIAGLGLRDGSVRQLSGGDSVLASLYRQAAALVYPSLYEGFGIPPLEAMSLDCPVLCSRASSLPEVVGDAALLFDPADIDEIRDAMRAVAGSAEVRSDLIARGRQRARNFSWERCAAETMEVYRETVQ